MLSLTESTFSFATLNVNEPSSWSISGVSIVVLGTMLVGASFTAITLKFAVAVFCEKLPVAE